MQTNASQHGLNIRSINVYLIDTTTDEGVLIVDFKAIEKWTKHNKQAQRFLKKYKRQNIMRKIHRYGSYAFIINRNVILKNTNEIASPATIESLKQSSGGYKLPGGVKDWTAGSFARVLKRLTSRMKATYVCHFGNAPKS